MTLFVNTNGVMMVSQVYPYATAHSSELHVAKIQFFVDNFKYGMKNGKALMVYSLWKQGDY